MSKEERLKAELLKIGIHNETELREAVKKATLNISLMAAAREERGVA